MWREFSSEKCLGSQNDRKCAHDFDENVRNDGVNSSVRANDNWVRAKKFDRMRCIFTIQPMNAI